jgi:putative Holliday junction resolvase
MARILGLDLGERRIGVAVSDPTELLARPVTTIIRASRQADFDAVARLVDEYAVARVIVGLPLSLDGNEGPQAQWVRRYAEAMAQQMDIPVEYWDERYSTVSAAEIISNKGPRRRAPRHDIDATAAAVILQSYLDAQSTHLASADDTP